MLFPATGKNAGRNINRANMVRPWLFLLPAMIALGLYLAYPVFATLWYSMTDRDAGNAFVGFDNYRQMFAEPKFWEAMNNNMLWLIIVPAASTAFGLLAAQLTDRIKWGNFAKSLIFMPMAISFVGASVIFKLIYDTRPVDTNQIGVLNAVWLQFNGGVGSFLILRLIPAALVACFVAALAYVGYNIARKRLAPSHKQGSAFASIASAGLVSLCLVAVIVGLKGFFGLFTFDFPYGVPQTWLTTPTWNSILSDGGADLDPDRLCHGDLVGGPARYARGNH